MFYRWQYGHYTLDQMQSFVSADGGESVDAEHEGICACASASELLRNTVWADGKYAAGAEVLALDGDIVEWIYDGVRIYPTRILARYSPAEFRKLHEAGELD